ncbi:cardiolipin synthase ClsB [Bordetella hinzii]|uniref:Cardiolipin synthase B n=3 Tax=Bordetella hinzii TaxID=103855 RepID=A0AAN1VHI6_9BORD|nr:cardiolipin synthase ClsB [Bordetella hinzii]AKQ60271.1 Putative cardiolipin synthase YbhO [Bordetella hinzii]AZW18658.1 cardiolipin synthase ClsB [Bordetella hinzii]KCB24550.1 putative cardiolipin synthetase YbhO [Bordetella hinzii OH87 BAL007II]KCB39437.1 putative cardiolipin synthetase YbhO [Bordetella hinzii 5132]KCB42586.1 putative cardiolipin synthetase YbhO [Bordetella hinzii 4161]
MSAAPRTDNRYVLLENGEALFPAVEAAIAEARHSVLAETFILFDDSVGRRIQQALIAAAGRGVSVDLTLDGYGSDALGEAFLGALARAGVRVHLFDPRPRLMGMRTHVFRRMHRKLLAVDDRIAFVGGINFSEDHLSDYGAQAKQDYALRIEGPLCLQIAAFMRNALRMPGAPPLPGPARRDGEGAASLVVRDNQRHRDDIERGYRASLRAATRDVLIANAYFFPGYRLLRALAGAARRGLRVRLILQGEPDMRLARLASTMIYDYLLDAGVEIHEYARRPLHAKVACFDDAWSTVGSSNLDPFSLALNLEANVWVRDPALNRQLRQSLERLLAEDCRRVPPRPGKAWSLRRLWAGVVVYHVLRRVPSWAGSLPAHKPRLARVPAPAEP